VARISPSGDRVDFTPADDAHPDAVQANLLGAVVSYVLLRRGYEPLHATVVSRHGRAFALLGDSGYGKSSLAACLIAEHGWALVTDDLLVIRDPARPRAEVGLQRLKLEPAVAARYFATSGPRIAPGASKMLVPMTADHSTSEPAPIAAFFALPPPSANNNDVDVVRRAEGDAFQVLIENTFNSVIIERIRLADQFVFAQELARRVPMFELSYPRGTQHLSRIAEAVIDHVPRV
jgi:hypothetical protein